MTEANIGIDSEFEDYKVEYNGEEMTLNQAVETVKEDLENLRSDYEAASEEALLDSLGVSKEALESLDNDLGTNFKEQVEDIAEKHADSFFETNANGDIEVTDYDTETKEINDYTLHANEDSLEGVVEEMKFFIEEVNAGGDLDRELENSNIEQAIVSEIENNSDISQETLEKLSNSENENIKEAVAENALSEDKSFAEAAIEGLGETLSQSAIENNLSSESAFDRGMGEWFQELDKPKDEGFEK